MMSNSVEAGGARAGFGQSKVLASLSTACRRTASALRIIIGIFAFFLILEFITSLGLVPAIYLPRASTVVERMLELLADPKFLKQVVATLEAWAIGLAVATLISVPVGILIGTSDLAYKMSSPVIEFMRPIPSVALIPLAILLWGQGFSMKIILVAYATTWPILFNTVYGVHDVDPIAVQTARCFGLKHRTILLRINLPSAAPLIFTGIRISASIGLIVVIGAELLASADSGIGSYILFVSLNGGHMDSVLAGAAIAGMVGALINSLLGIVDRRIFAWRYLGAAAQ
jgi:NitT/TauT family transport system permease protein